MPDPNPFQARLARLADLRKNLASFEGHAASPDGLIKVTCTAEDPLQDLQLHPRALKLLNADLAAAIQQTAAAARQDLKRQTNDALTETLGEDDLLRSGVDPTAARARLSELTTMMESAGRDATAAFEQLRRQFGG